MEASYAYYDGERSQHVFAKITPNYDCKGVTLDLYISRFQTLMEDYIASLSCSSAPICFENMVYCFPTFFAHLQRKFGTVLVRMHGEWEHFGEAPNFELMPEETKNDQM